MGERFARNNDTEGQDASEQEDDINSDNNENNEDNESSNGGDQNTTVIIVWDKDRNFPQNLVRTSSQCNVDVLKLEGAFSHSFFQLVDKLEYIRIY